MNPTNISESSFNSGNSCLDELEPTQIDSAQRSISQKIYDRLIVVREDYIEFGTPIWESVATFNDSTSEDHRINIIPLIDIDHDTVQSILFIATAEYHFNSFFVPKTNITHLGFDSLESVLGENIFVVREQEILELFECFECLLYCRSDSVESRDPEPKCPKWKEKSKRGRFRRGSGGSSGSNDPDDFTVYVWLGNSRSLYSYSNYGNIFGGGGSGGAPTYTPGQFLQRIEGCDGFGDIYDTGPNNPTGGHPDSAFCIGLFDLQDCLPTIGFDDDIIDWYLWYESVYDSTVFESMQEFACTSRMSDELIIKAVYLFRDRALLGLLPLFWFQYAQELDAIQNLINLGVDVNFEELTCLINQPQSSILLEDYVQDELNQGAGPEIIDFGTTATDLLCADSYVKMQRMIELNELIQSDPYALIIDCINQIPVINLQDYSYLYNFDIPQVAQDYLDSQGAGFENQPIEEGNVAVTNVDDYSVEITSLPDLDNDGLPESIQEIWNDIRGAFTDLASGTANNFEFSCNNPFGPEIADMNWTFVPYSPISEATWESSDPVTAIFVIPTSVSEPTLDFLSDHGAVIVSQNTECCWINSSIQTPSSNTQPFSGNRQFGFRINDNGNMEIYTKAIDVARRSPFVIFAPSSESCETKTYYDIAKATWNNFQAEIKQDVELNDGTAVIQTPAQALYDNDLIMNLLKSTNQITYVPCD